MPFKKGKSGNPGGRPKMPDDLKAACQQYSEEALEIMVKWMRQQKFPAISLKACEAIHNRAWGTPIQSVDVQANLEGTVALLPIAIPRGSKDEWLKAAEQLRLDSKSGATVPSSSS